MIRHIMNNIKYLLKKEKLFILMLIIVQTFSVIIIFSSYGIINHYNTKIEEVEGDTLRFPLYTPVTEHGNPDAGIKYTYEEARDFFDTILPRIANKIDYIFADGVVYIDKGTAEESYIEIDTSAGYKRGKYTTSRYFNEKFNYYDMEGLSQNDYDNASRIAYITPAVEIYCKKLLTGNKLMLGNSEYIVMDVINNDAMYPVAFVPFTAFPEEVEIAFMSFFTKSPLTRSEYEFIKEAAEKYLGGKAIIPEFDGIENESDYRVYRNMIFIIIGMVFICGINYCIIYHYLIYRNRNAFAICRICGCTRGRAAFGYIAELMAESAAMFALGTFVFYKFVFEKMGEYFEYASFYYDSSTVMNVFVIYMGILFIMYFVQIYRYVRKSPSELIKEEV